MAFGLHSHKQRRPETLQLAKRLGEWFPMRNSLLIDRESAMTGLIIAATLLSIMFAVMGSLLLYLTFSSLPERNARAAKLHTSLISWTPICLTAFVAALGTIAALPSP